MTLYQKLAQHYDSLFPVSDKKISWIQKALELRKSDKVLDLGCGTGSYVVSFAERGHEAYGIDSDYGMIDKAIKTIEKRNLNKAHVAVGDILEQYPFESTYNGIMCIGNTLPHLQSVDEVANSLELAKNHLSDDGVLIIQTVNYDLNGIENKTFPTLTAKEGRVRFNRHYSPKSEIKVNFHTELEIDQANCDNNDTEVYHSTIELLCLRKHNLEKILLDLDFRNIDFYCGFTDKLWDYDGSGTVAIAKK
ncbi:class I SAM-dependent methyltransferase [Natranaerobius trueperi]|uniref:Methyltransferase domain-containing protein n=1 Tax=Natranaerobius trueperi TaxID=759412 RepID=A0A226BZ35_9FIRM|nr:class I SAM-dependent methyltransferase [Natranaerobius trueperi]OWZ83584.1 hypothetical protein CDO51_07685 [Natranaerobius trueperi]